MNVYKILLVGAGGFVGSVARYITAKSIDEKLIGYFPYSTLTINVVGSFILGLIYGYSLKVIDSENLRLLLGVGFCGGFTTFSTFALENFKLFDQRMMAISLVYIGISIFGSILAVAGGVWITKY